MFLLVGTSVRALMESAAHSGYPVMGIDYFGDQDSRLWGKTMGLMSELKLTPTIKELLQVAQTIPCQGLVYASGPENHPDELIFWEEKGLLYGNGIKALKQVRNPWRLQQALSEIGIKMPTFYRLQNMEKTEESENSKAYKNIGKSGKRWLLKPFNRGGGHGIIELSDEVKISTLTNSIQSSYIIQEYIPGIPASVTFVANGQDAVVLGTSRQLSGAKEEGLNGREYSYAGNIVPLASEFTPGLEAFEEDLARIANHLTLTFKLKGINTLDFMISEHGVRVLELNPRWSASVELIEKWRGERLFPYHIAGCQSMSQRIPRQMPKPQPEARGKLNEKTEGFWGKKVVYAQSSFEVRTLEEGVSDLYVQGVRDIPSAGTSMERGQPICTILAWAPSDRECEQRLVEKSVWARMAFGDINLQGGVDHGNH